MEQNQNQFKCSGDCLRCSPAQRAYCASQHSYSNMKVLDMVMQTVTEMKGTMEEMRVKIEAIQNNEASVFDPTKETVTTTDIAQEGVGV